MPYQKARIQAIGSACAEAQVPVKYYKGYATRGSSIFNPLGFANHHDAGNSSMLELIVKGRPGVPGPLSQFYIERDGTLWIIAAGRANHAGRGGYNGLYGNTSCWGVEIANNGVGERYTNAQLYTVMVLNSVVNEVDGIPLSRIFAHFEWTARKIDPSGPPRNRSANDLRWAMDKFRSDVDKWEVNGMASKEEIAEEVIRQLSLVELPNKKGRFFNAVHNIVVHGERVDDRVGQLYEASIDPSTKAPRKFGRDLKSIRLGFRLGFHKLGVPVKYNPDKYGPEEIEV